mmetsp:Transcript_72624/g.190365  ORF Transcript_72624/g.190365 Transcript_72624/m.190365 type:complete len:273 (+) Transcript_72624:167-985(+)
MPQKWNEFCPKFHLPTALPTQATASRSTPYSKILGFIMMVRIITPNDTRNKPLTRFPQKKQGAKEKMVTQMTIVTTGSVKPSMRTSLFVLLYLAGRRSSSAAAGVMPFSTALITYRRPCSRPASVSTAAAESAKIRAQPSEAAIHIHSLATTWSRVRPSQVTSMKFASAAMPCTDCAIVIASRNISRRELAGTRYFPMVSYMRSSPLPLGSGTTKPWCVVGWPASAHVKSPIPPQQSTPTAQKLTRPSALPSVTGATQYVRPPLRLFIPTAF